MLAVRSVEDCVGTRFDCDLCILGGGAGGLALAAGAARLGARVVLVEARELGGECLHAGCVPSKALLTAAATAHAIGHAARCGLHTGPLRVDFAGVRRWIRRAIDAIAPRDSAARFEALGVRVIHARGRFTGPERVLADGKAIRARRFAIATGSRPAIPDIPGLNRVPVLTGADLFQLAEAPTRLLVLGGGPAGVELAQAMARLGVPTTLVQRRRLLPRLPAELAASVRAALVADGVEVLEETRVEEVLPGPRLKLVRNGQRFERAGSHLLLATGRRPNIEDLGLEAAGIHADASGIRTDARLRTTNPRVFALGDVTGRPHYSHAAAHQAGVVLQNALLGLPVRLRENLIPHTLYTDPELVVAGRLEPTAGVRLVDWPYEECDRALIEARSEGFIRLAVDRRRRLVGVGIVGPRAGELYAAFAPILAGRARLADLARVPLPYPTYGELARRAAGRVFEELVFGRAMRLWVRLVGRLVP